MGQGTSSNFWKMCIRDREYTDLMLRQNKILGNMLGADIDFVVRGIDSKARSVVEMCIRDRPCPAGQ